MSAKQLIGLLEKHVKLHKGLLHLANKKTEILKNGDMEALTEVIKEEQKYATAIKQIERERVHAVETMYDNLPSPKNDGTLTECIALAEGEEREALERLRDDLSTVLAELKDVNLLNQQLIQQSLYFVNVTLDMVLPQPQDINYGKRSGDNSSAYENRRSMFDSKA